ncbi:MAG: hypothetical protein HOP01_07375 [Gallionella sp.]|nr:hypothetical protein [Gallionella sp.]
MAFSGRHADTGDSPQDRHSSQHHQEVVTRTKQCGSQVPKGMLMPKEM